MRIKTSKRKVLWTVQKKVSGSWRVIVDSEGPIVIATRKLARNISREFRNTNGKGKRIFRVSRYSVT